MNIRLDLGDAEKVSNYIPTEKSDMVIEHVAAALRGKAADGAVMLIGSYGTGKSHLATFLGSAAGRTVPNDCFQPVVQKLRSRDARKHVEALLNEGRYLVVAVSGSADLRLDQQLLLSLRRTIDEQGLDIELTSSYTAATQIIERWEKLYPNTYQALTELLASTSYPDADSLLAGLASFDAAALRVFVEKYPELTAGASFDLLSGQVVEVFQSACLALVQRGYKGIMVVFDEFNKVMDASIKDGHTFKTMQDLAEMASRADQGFALNIVLISHRTISQYVDEVDAVVADEWRKIEGRFRIFDVSNRPWENYDLISRVLRKERQDFFEQLSEHNPVIQEVAESRLLNTLFDGLNSLSPNESFDVTEVIARGCLPLHPVTVFLLPRISSKLAQNERTLFTFLAGQDNSPLPAALEREVDHFSYVLPWELYDYFEDQLSRAQDPDLRGIWTKVTNALESLPENATPEHIELLKTIGVLLVGGNSTSLPCTHSMVEFALAGQDASSAIADLVQRKLIFVKQSTGEIDIVEPADFDAAAAVEEWLKTWSPSRSPFELLQQLEMHYVIPQRYNHKAKMTRFFSPAYAGIGDLRSILPAGELAPQFDAYDGVICYLFPENREELVAMSELATNVRDPRALVVLPTTPLQIRPAILRAAALDDVKQKLKEDGADKRVLHLAELHLQDAKQELSNKLAKLVVPSIKLRYFWQGIERSDVTNQQTLSGLCSEIMDKVYDESPCFNNELVNKAAPTLTSRRARNDVIDAVLGERTDLRASLRSAQERFMFDTLYGLPRLYDEAESRLITSWPKKYSVLQMIEDYYKAAGDEQRGFEPLIRALYAPPYGVRGGVIPALLASCIVKLKLYITIKDASGRDCQIDASLLDKIVETPRNYSIKLEAWNPALERLTSGLAEIFGKGRPDEVFFANRFGELGYEVFRWFSGLPRYSRETAKVSRPAQMLRRIAKISSQRPRQALLAELPRVLRFETVTLENVDELLETVRTAKTDVETALTRLGKSVRARLEEFLLDFGRPQETVISLARNMVQDLTADGVSIEWSNLAAYVLGFETFNEDEFVYGLTHKLTGIRLEDWLDTTEDDLSAVLDDIRNASKQAAASEDLGPRIELAFHETAKAEKVVLQICEVSDLGEMLQAHIETSIDNFGDAISPLEKRQILINILRKSL